MSVTNPFDFVNTDWIENEELRAKIQGESGEKVLKCVQVFEHPAYADYAQPLDIHKFTAAYEGVHGPGSAPVPSTLRNYLNKAVAEGKLCKPTRQTYGMPGVTQMPNADEIDEQGNLLEEVPAPVAPVEADPLDM